MQSDIETFLASRMPGFVARSSQQQMADLVAEAVHAKQNALIEAGTGTGKTYAYLVPLLTTDKKIIVSTGTKTLQDQLFLHDLPFVNEQIGRTTALLKGRSNYLCLERFHKHLSHSSQQIDSSIMEQLVTLYSWAEHTKTGDLNEILDEEDQGSLQGLITSTADNCLGQECPSFDRCFLYKARQRALQADVVVVNHHLFFADLALKEDDLGELLPSADVIVIDEAHQVEEVARTFFGQRLSSGQLFELSKDIVREQVTLGMDDPELLKGVQTFENALARLVQNVALQEHLTIADIRNSDVLGEVDLALSRLISRLGTVAQRSAGMDRCYVRACRIGDMFTLLTEPLDDDGSVHYVERRKQGFTIHLLPIDVAEHLEPFLMQPDKVWLFVSATLAATARFAVDPNDERDAFRHFRAAVGMSDGLAGRFPSPFDFPNQVAGFVPNLPDPRDGQHTSALVARVLPLLRSHRGRSLLLFTSHKAMNEASVILSREHDLSILEQGALAKEKLIATFRRTEQAVLLATHSFWQGVDLSGSDLRLLVIDKLPFTSPDDPVFQAKLNLIDAAGGNSFVDLSLPRAAITLKQGFGRLIRKETDAGLFVLGDGRINVKSYGKTLKRCLPDIPWLQEMPEAIDYLERLNGNTSD